MKKKVFTLPLLALLMMCLAAIVTSCDIFDSDDTEIVIKNESNYARGEVPWYITEIDIKDNANRQVYFTKGLKKAPGESKTVSIDAGGTYRIKITAQQMGYTTTGALLKGEKKYYNCVGDVPNGDTRTVVFDGDSLGFD